MTDYEIGKMLIDSNAQNGIDAYKKGRAEGEVIGITRVLDILEHLDKQMLEMVKDYLYEQDYTELKEQKE